MYTYKVDIFLFQSRSKTSVDCQ